jgi:hypothetical protein
MAKGKNKWKISNSSLQKSEDFFIGLAKSLPRDVDTHLAGAEKRDLEILVKLLFNTCNGNIGMGKVCHKKFLYCN